jgi:hypothetical protein
VKRIIPFFLLSTFAATAFGATAPQGRVVAEGGLVDVDLPIVSYHIDKDQSLELVARGSIDGREVAFEVRLDSKGDSKSGGEAFIQSVGRDSDAFVEMLARQYGLHATALKMVPRVSVMALTLPDGPGAAGKEPIKMKIFFNANGGPNYAEAFLNIDIENKTLGFHDKDPEYHAGILASLSAGG